MTLKYQISNIKYQINKFKRLLGYSPPGEAGQMVLMLVLITIVGLTIGLSLISRTVTDIRISSQIEQSSRAFSAAEAGIETALKGAVAGGPTGTVTLPGASGSYAVNQLGGTTDVYTFSLTSPGTSQAVWLIDHNADGSLNEAGSAYPTTSALDICWGTDPNINPAMVVNLYYKQGGNYKVVRGAYDPITTHGNNFAVSDSAGNYCTGNYRFKKTITASGDFGIPAGAKLLMLRLLPVYESTKIAIKAASTLPVQGKVISSVGQTETGVVRKIQVSQGYNQLPSLLDFGLFVEN